MLELVVDDVALLAVLAVVAWSSLFALFNTSSVAALARFEKLGAIAEPIKTVAPAKVVTLRTFLILISRFCLCKLTF